MKKVLFREVLFSLFLFFAFSGCQVSDLSVREFFELYTGSAAIEKVDSPELSGVSKDGLPCINSFEDKSFKFYLRNPQKYALTTSYKFNNLAMQDYYEENPGGVEFSYNEDNDIGIMVFNKSFLDKVDNGKILDNGEICKDISGSICIQDDIYTHSIFDPYAIKIMANSKPERVRGACFQMNNLISKERQYVVCFNIKKIENTVHKNDTHNLYIGKNHWTFEGNPENLTEVFVEDRCHISTNPPDILKNIDGSDSSFDVSDENYIHLYFTTNINVADDGRVYSYDIRLSDDYGLDSKAVVSNQSDQLVKPETNVVNGENYGADENEGVYSLVINHTRGTYHYEMVDENTQTKVPGATCKGIPFIVYTVKNNSGSIVATGTKQAPVTVNLPMGKDYSVDAYAIYDGYVDSDSIDTTKFSVTRSNNYYVSQITGNDETGTGSKNAPYETFEKCKEEIKKQYDLFEEMDSCVINLMSDISATDATVIKLENESYFANTEVTIQGYNRVRKIKVQKSSGNGSPKGISISTNTPDMTLNLNNLEITNENGYGIMVYNDSNAINLNLENVTVKDCYSNNEAGGIYFSNTNGKLSLSNVTVTNNTCMTGGIFAGGGILFEKGSIEVKNQVIIKNNVWINTTSGEEKVSNLYLNKDGENQIPIIIKGKLSAGSQIGVSCAVAPEGDEPVIFTEGYSIDNYNINPGLIFTSDDNIGITLDEDYSDGEVCLLLNRGSFTDILKSVSIKLNCRENYFIPGQSKTILITPKLHIYDEEMKGADYLNKLGWKTWLTCDGVTVGTVKTGTGSNIIYEIPASGLTEDVFVLHVQAWYNFDADNKSQIFDDEYILYPPKSMDKLSAAPTNGCYYVTDASELGMIKTWSINGSVFENVTFVLKKDITVNSVNNFCITKYSGIFDGNGKKITVNLTAGNEFFALFKYGDNCLIRNTTMNGTISTAYRTVGAFIASALGNKSDLDSINVIENCINNVNITSGKTYVGGFVGYARSLCIRNSVNNGKIECNQTITGQTSCNVGGFVGAIEGGTGVQLYIENCVNNGDVIKTDYTNIQNANKRAGGIIGGMDYPNISVKNVAMAGKITDGCEMAAILYKSYDKNFNNCYYLNGSGIGAWYLGTYNSNYVNGFSSKQQIVNQLNTWIENQTDSFIYKKWKVESDKIVFN